MRDKLEARRPVKKAGVPAASGSVTPGRSAHMATRDTEKTAYAILLKEAGGEGGGMEMNILVESREFWRAFKPA
jgi:acetyl/propionyl-CoA carboxylase alpha subunit